MLRIVLVASLFALGCGHRTTVSAPAKSDPSSKPTPKE